MKKKTIILSIACITAVLITVGIYFFVENKNIYKDADIKQQEAEDMAKAVLSSDIKSDISGKEVVPGEDSNLYPRINFSKLMGIEESEIYGWLYIPDTNIDYIVMQGNKKEPYKYLWKDPRGGKSKTGSLFVRYGQNGNEATNIIYGHRLKDHNIYFGQLLSFKDEDYAKAHNECYIYRPDKEEKYALYAVVEGLETDIIYCYPYFNDTEEYELLLADIKDKASFILSDKIIDPNNKILVLSTCSGKRAGDSERLYLIYILEDTHTENK